MASTPARLLIALAACAGPALALPAAQADPEVPMGAICDVVAPAVAGAQQGQDGEARGVDPTRSFSKLDRVQGILNRIQQNGGLTSGAPGADVGAVIRAVQSGDLGAAAAAGSDLANTVRPLATGENRDDSDGAAPTGNDLANTIRSLATDENQDDSDGAAQNTSPPVAQGTPLIDQGALNAARNTVRQDCERAKAATRSPDDQPASDDAGSDDGN